MKHPIVCLFLLVILAVNTIEGATWVFKACTKANFGGTCETRTNIGSGCYPINGAPYGHLGSFKITVPSGCAFNLWSQDSCYGSKLGHATKTWTVNAVSSAGSKAHSYSMEGQGC